MSKNYILECSRSLVCPEYGKSVCCFTCSERHRCKILCKQTVNPTCKYITGYDYYLDPMRGRSGDWIIILKDHIRDGVLFKRGEMHQIGTVHNNSDINIRLDMRTSREAGSDYWSVGGYVMSLIDTEKVPKTCKYCINNCKLNKEDCPLFSTVSLKMDY